jgi:hypothetical protein
MPQETGIDWEKLRAEAVELEAVPLPPTVLRSSGPQDGAALLREEARRWEREQRQGAKAWEREQSRGARQWEQAQNGQGRHWWNRG